MKKATLFLLTFYFCAQTLEAQKVIEGISEYKALNIPENKTNSGSNNNTNNTTSNVWRFDWRSPDTRGINETNPLVLNDSHLPMVVNIDAPMKLSDADCSVFINGAPLPSPKTGVTDLDESGSSDNVFYHKYIKDLYFDGFAPGKYKIEIQVSKNGEQKRSAPLWVQYNPEKIKLFILSLGVPHSNLKYTGNDARDFANAFKDQQTLYKEVNTNFFDTSEKTIKTKIIGGLTRLATSYKNKEITDKDMIIIFISSHGAVLDGNKFGIQASDYDGFTETMRQATSVSYTEINEILKDVNCKKIMFIDACHSGAGSKEELLAMKSRGNEVETALKDLLKITDSWTIITSSNEEKSWEHSNWENGSFTEAILEAFSARKGEKADTNSDGMLSFKELHDYLKVRCPELNKSVKFDAQNPQMKRADNADLKFFSLKHP